MKKFIGLFFIFLFCIQVQASDIKYIFLIIGDGMSMSSEYASSQFLYGKDKQLFWNKFPIQTLMTTWSLSTYKGEYDKNSFDANKGYDINVAGIVPYPYYKTDESEKYFRDCIPTESSASATAMSTGEKIDNDGVCYDKRNDKFLKNIVDVIKEKNKFNFALMTTDLFYSATPASFFSHQKIKFKEKEIAKEILYKTKPEIIIGKNDFYELNDVAQANNYYFIDCREINSPKVFDFNDKKIFINLNKYIVPNPQENFSTDSFIYNSDNIKFSNIVLYGIKILLDRRKPFFTLIEVCDIDKANHDNIYSKMLGGVYELNEIVKSIYDLINSNTTDMNFDNTIIIVTADHSTGMLRFNKHLGKGVLPLQGIVYTENMNIQIDKKINYKKQDHTNELVGCYSIGAYSDIFNKYINKKNIIDNTDIYNILKDIIN